MDRRTLLKAGAVAVAGGAVAAGIGVQRARRAWARRSDTITGAWHEMGEFGFLLADLEGARVVVPDRPHSSLEAHDGALRSAIQRIRTFRVSTNDRHLRQGPIQSMAPAGVLRILIVGDSVTFGWGVEDDQTLPVQLQALLTARDHTVEVVNGGCPAMQNLGCARFLTHVAPQLNPDVVIFNRRPDLHESETYANLVTDAMQALPAARLMLAFNPVSTFDPQAAGRHRAIGRRVRKQLQGTPVVDLTPVFRRAQGDRGTVLEARRGRHMVVQAATGEVLLDVPELLTADGKGSNDLDPRIYALFEARPDVREALMFDQGHPDAEGFAVYAASLADALDGTGWLTA